MDSMMQNCWNWMMSLGMVGMLLGTLLLIAIVVLLIIGITRLIKSSRK